MLSIKAIREIVNLRVQVVKDRLLAKGIQFQISDEALSYLAREGYDPHYGARPLNRLIQNKILNPVASYIISNGVKVVFRKKIYLQTDHSNGIAKALKTGCHQEVYPA